MDELPLPDGQALQISDALQARVRSLAQTAGGWLGFDRFMQAALYEPGLGYYVAGARRFGASGDFVTAPELTPLFGHCLAGASVEWLESLAPTITEFGAGTGQLAAQMLNALERLGRTPERYRIIEVSPALREQQRHTLELMCPGLVGRVQWLDHLPDSLDGLIVANEVLDAMPVRLFELHEGAIHERGLMRGQSDAPLVWQTRLADAAFAARVRRALAGAGWGGADPLSIDLGAWPEGYASELPEAAAAWLDTIAERLSAGVLLLIDYGFPAREFYHPQRAGGTLACHYRHRVHHDPLLYPGLQDITVHVDFTALARRAERAGLEVLGYTSQANFLLNAGLLDGLAGMPRESPEYLRQAQAVQRLVSEAEMGELFKVIAVGRGVHSAGPGFGRGGRLGGIIDSDV
ncbi:MAG: SAM-dependent methyltransferase [Burkholderiaceae bacterium]